MHVRLIILKQEETEEVNPMTKWLILLSLLFVNTVYANNTTVPKRNNFKPEHSKHEKRLHHKKVHTTHVKQTEVKRASQLERFTLSDSKIIAVMDKYNVNSSKQRAIIDAVNNAAKKHKISRTLIVAMIARESSFKQYAISSKGARGLLQIMPSHKISNPFNINTNIDKGVEILAKYIKESGNIYEGLARYGSSTEYVREVTTTLQQLHAMV